MPSTSDTAPALARRLRELRLHQWDRVITQSQLGGALGCSVPSISSWEKNVVPTDAWLGRYATFFATPRSVASGVPHLLPVEELTSDEQASRDKLERELLELRESALREASPSAGESRAPAVDLWRYPEGEPVTIVCAELPADLRETMPYTDPNSPDYTELYTYADLDSLLEVHGYIRAVNPNNPVNVRLDNALSAADYVTNLVLLGGVDWNDATQLVLEQLASVELTRGMPVGQRSRNEGDAEAHFHVGDDRFSPVFAGEESAKRLVEDVAHFFRGPNPMAETHTVTICNGMYGRGTLGAVRTLTDVRFRDRNTAYVLRRFGDSLTYSILSRVRILRGQVVTPDWTVADTRLHEWPD